MEASKLLDVLCQVVVGIAVGFITYWASSKLWPASIKKDAMTHTLEHALSPILKIIRPARTISIDDLILDIKSIDKIMKENPFDIPPLHRCKMDDLNIFIELYDKYKTDSENKQAMEKKIRTEYSSYVTMFSIQCNYVKKQLGYPYSNFYDSLRYETGSPFFATLFLSFIFAIWMFLYVMLFLNNEKIKAILVIIVPGMLFLIYAIIYRVLKNRGGVRVVINNLKSRKKNKHQPSIDSEQQK